MLSEKKHCCASPYEQAPCPKGNDNKEKDMRRNERRQDNEGSRSEREAERRRTARKQHDAVFLRLEDGTEAHAVTGSVLLLRGPSLAI